MKLKDYSKSAFGFCVTIASVQSFLPLISFLLQEIHRLNYYRKNKKQQKSIKVKDLDVGIDVGHQLTSTC